MGERFGRKIEQSVFYLAAALIVAFAFSLLAKEYPAFRWSPQTRLANPSLAHHAAANSRHDAGRHTS